MSEGQEVVAVDVELRREDVAESGTVVVLPVRDVGIVGADTAEDHPVRVALGPDVRPPELPAPGEPAESELLAAEVVRPCSPCAG